MTQDNADGHDVSVAVESNEETASPADENQAAEEPTEVEAQPCEDFPLATRVESILMTVDRPMPEAKLGELIGVPAKGRAKVIRDAVDELNAFYEQTGRSFRVDRVAGGFQILTQPDFGPLLLRLHTDRTRSRLSGAALETLSILAYRQPIMRAEIEAIRGVACGEVLRGLMERRLCKIVGRAEELGRPMLYGTTQEFLNVFGLASLDDLPVVEGLERAPAYRPPEPEVTPSESESASEPNNDAAEESVVEVAAVAPEAEENATAPAEVAAESAEKSE